MPRYATCLFACPELRLASFRREPHLVEKVRWTASDAAGMRPINWFDVALRGSPWIVLAVMAIADARRAAPQRGVPD